MIYAGCVVVGFVAGYFVARLMEISREAENAFDYDDKDWHDL